MSFACRKCLQIVLTGFLIVALLMAVRGLKIEINRAQLPAPPSSRTQQQGQKASFDLDGLKAVISAAGVLSFALGYINSAKKQTVKGILMGEVIAKAYPYYGYLFVLHAVFVLMGLYCCSAKYEAPALWCTAGVLVCLLFAAIMAVETALSERGQERLVGSYIKNVPADLKAERSEDQIELREQHVQAVAQYVGQRFLLRDWLITKRHSKKRGLFSEGGDIALLLELPDPNRPKGGEALLNIREEFGRRFPEAIVQGPQGEKELKPHYILAVIPGVQEHKQRFRQAMLLYAEMWRGMMAEGIAPHRKGELVYRILSMDDGKFTSIALCCGLLLYLTDPGLYNASGADYRAIQIGRSAFVQEINRRRESDLRQSQAEAASDGQKNMGIICWNMCLINFGLSMFEQMFLPELTGIRSVSDIVCQFLEEETRLGVRFYRSHNDLRMYLSFAYIIAELHHTMYRADLLRAIPTMIQIIMDEIDRGGVTGEL